MGVRLKDIAEAAGVSISTVSRILNKDPTRKSSDETTRRVIETARDLGYLAELPAKLQALSADAAGRTYDIGCILTSDHESFASPFFSTLLAGIQNELARTGSRILHKFSILNFMDGGIDQLLRTTPLDCAIMLGRTSLENINLLRERIPVLVYAGVNEVGAGFDEVLCDGHEGAIRAVRHLAELGHRDIGFIGSTPRKYRLYNERRYQGFLDGMAASGLEVDEDWVVDCLLTSAQGYEGMRALLGRKRLPTAIFCGNDTVALGAMRALDEGGISVPGDISIIGFDDIDTASYVKPPLTTIAIPTRELGRLSVKVMLDRIETGRDYPLRLSLPFRLVERESCRALSRA